jgi:ribonuclease HI
MPTLRGFSVFTAFRLIYLFTDGSSRGNPGPGGYGAILRFGQHEKELTQGFRLTTNNRMELLAVIVGLEAINRPELPITVVTDSKYVVDSVEKKWVFNWLNKPDFGKKANEDLWRRFVKVYKQRTVQFRWVRGHNGHPENERCDQLAVQSATRGPLLTDEGYELIERQRA